MGSFEDFQVLKRVQFSLQIRDQFGGKNVANGPSKFQMSHHFLSDA
jgi:hypothetical protein